MILVLLRNMQIMHGLSYSSYGAEYRRHSFAQFTSAFYYSKYFFLQFFQNLHESTFQLPSCTVSSTPLNCEQEENRILANFT